MEKKITINDIARIANVSKSTVSRYLNGGSISPKTREKIDDVVVAHNYQPNAFAQSLKQQINHTVGVIVPRLDSSAQTEMLRGLDNANQDDIFLIVNSYQDEARELAAIERLSSQNIGGLILLTANISANIRQLLEQFDIPIVIQGQDDSGFHRVVMNDVEAGRNVAAYLLTLAPRRVLLLGIDAKKDQAIGHDRFNPIQQALHDHQIVYDMVMSDFNLQVAKDDALTAMQQQQYDVVVAATDRMAVGALQASLTLHQSPKIIGFGQSDMSRIVTPNLTSFEYDFFETGRALYHLFDEVRHHPEPQKKRILINGQLTVRASTN
ncbi:LacI family DNA-binding transcriptional regulator [Leuconostoc fallax]|uniref:LacI family DNA-binding transcriptional regulator n=1 Tax=Leuconostoc fallax TaxID=1251 RepID=UPI00209070DA|nr:LacI family DNA-binding transcriptional regulator [Leuconostoc fallax]MCO6184562.1 LacI family DNA-binding transcriptional regulator [Leuconostoc fallax]